MKSHFLALGCLVSTLAFAGDPDKALLSSSKLADPQPPRSELSEGKFEVEAIFWFGCSYCQQLDPLLRQWEARRPDITLISVPAPLSELMASHARAFYAQKVLGGAQDLKSATYKTVVESGGRAIANGEDFARFMSGNGFDADASREMYFSQFVTNAVRYDFNRLKAYNLSVAPSIVINGEYLVTGSSAGGIPEMIVQAEKIISAIEQKSKLEGEK